MPPTFSLADIRFLLSRSRGEWLPEEQGGVAAFGPTGLRDVQGVGNNTSNIESPGYWFGAADTLFPRLTFNRLTAPSTKNDVISGPFANNKRGATFTLDDTVSVDSRGFIVPNGTSGATVRDALNPRNISNLVVDSSNPVGFSSLDPTDPNYDAKLKLKLQDDPTGRISPVSGAVNPLPYSNWTSQFGQFFDHGLDFVNKGVDGRVQVNMLPSDGLYTAGRATSISASRNNTANVTIGDGSTDALLQKMGLVDQQGKTLWTEIATITDPSAAGGGVAGGWYAYQGTLVLNNTLIKIAAVDEVDLVSQINSYAPTTGVTATVRSFPAIPNVSSAGAYEITLTPVRAESFNEVSPFIDLSQTYGSDASRTVFLREYLAEDVWKTSVRTTAEATIVDLTTGRLVNAGASVNGEVKAGIATWAQIKANALNIGITLRDADVTAIPMFAFDGTGSLILGPDGMPYLVALNRVTGEEVYVRDTDRKALSDQGLVLMTTRHAFLNDMGVRLPALNDVTYWNPKGDLIDSNAKTALEAHFVAGDGRLNENIGLTAVQEVFVTEHNRVVTLLKQQYGLTGEQPAGGWTWTDPLTGISTKITGEELFQQAKLFNEMIYQHLVFDQFVRKISPNIAGFAGVDPAIDARVTSEFANAVYRFGHSMLPEAVGMRKYADATAISTTAGSNVITVTLANHGLRDGDKVVISGMDAAVGGIVLDGEFVIDVTGQNTFTINAGTTASGAAVGLATDKIQFDVNKGLIAAFLNPQSYTPGATTSWLADGSTAQVGNRIDEKVTDALRDNLLGQPLDLATLNLIRGRDAGLPTLNEMRGAVQAVAPLALQATLTPYTSWKNFETNLKGTAADQAATVKNFIMAYASDAILTKFAPERTLQAWYALREGTSSDSDLYMAALKAAANAAYADAVWMGAGASGNKDFNRIDAWIGGLAEREVVGGMLGSTFDAVFAMQMMSLQNGDFFYYLGRVPAAEFFIENMEGVMLADLVMRSSGASNIYADIFSVADSYVQMGDIGQARATSLSALQSNTTVQQVFDASGALITASIGQAGYVTGGANPGFYGNTGNYVDARGVLNPNGVGNASEAILGTSGNDTVFAGGGNDSVRAGAGNDTVNGGAGVDFLYGGDGDDTLNGDTDDDFLYGEAGNDNMRGDLGIDTMFGGDGDDTMRGGLDADVMIGGAGNDIMYGGDGVTVGGVLDPDPVVGAGLIDDTMNGGAGNDTLYGGGGWDVLNGDSGHDILLPGAGGRVIGGREVMNGGEGDDLYVIEDALAFAHHDINDTGLTQLQRFVGVGDSLRAGNGIGIDEVRFTQTVAGDIILGGANDLGIVSAFVGVERVVIGTGMGINANRNGTAAINIDASLANPGLNVGLEILGNAGNNTIVGTIFADTLDGGLGDDVLEGGLGDDTYVLSAAGDQVIEATGGGKDTVIVDGAFNHTLAIDVEDLILRDVRALEGTGNALDNSITGNDANNILRGLAGNDRISGGGGNDQILGGAGVDILTGGFGRDTFVFERLEDIGNNSGFVETITDFDPLDDILDFTTIDANTVIGGLQQFTFIGNAPLTAPGQIRYDEETGLLEGNVNGDAAPDFRLVLANKPTLTASNFRRLAVASIAATTANLAEGQAGTTQHVFTVTLSEPLDTDATMTYTVSSTGLTNPAAAGDFQGGFVTGTLTIPANETTGTITINVLGDTTNESTEAFRVTISAPSQNLIIGTSQATSTIVNDDFNGTTGNNTITGSALNDTINGLAGNDTLNGGDGDDILNGGTGNDTLNGGNGNDTLNGDDGDDTLNGGNGNDILVGGTGRDTMTGGAGADVFVLRTTAESGAGNTQRDSITDFQSGLDKIDLSAIDANTVQTGFQGFVWVTGNFNAPGQLRFFNGQLQGNVNANTGVDFAISIGGGRTVTQADIIGLVTPSVQTQVVQTLALAPLATDPAQTGPAPVVTLDTPAPQPQPQPGQTLNGTTSANTLTGGTGDDTLNGLAGNDTLNGLAGNDTIIGGTGRDTMTGGDGADVFVFRATGESGVGATRRDIITDFQSGLDKIDLSAIDANIGAIGNNAFVWIGSAAFSAPGQVRYVDQGGGVGVLEANNNFLLTPDFSVEVRGGSVLQTDVIL